MSRADKTALVTGANSGLGFEAAAQLADDGWGRVILACRSVDKGDAAQAQLVERTGKDPFTILAMGTSEVASAEAAAEQLRERADQLDFLLLNAGASSKDASYNSDGVETTYASTLVGHHVLTMRALEYGLLAPQARIVIAGSEGARGDLPGMSVHDIGEIADKSFDGDRVAALDALLKVKTPAQKKFANMSEYVTAKLIVAWWAAALSRRLPTGITVNAVSPGGNMSTSFARDASAPMRLIMIPMMKAFGPMMGMNVPIDKGPAGIWMQPSTPTMTQDTSTPPPSAKRLSAQSAYKPRPSTSPTKPPKRQHSTPSLLSPASVSRPARSQNQRRARRRSPSTAQCRALTALTQPGGNAHTSDDDAADHR
jgi:NAD(P)-dependent dehydrogenase (short-subunit alcohol dehydrogenase family)